MGNLNSGRRPKPSALKVLEGNRGRRPLPNEPKARELIPDCPDWLNDQAKAEWARVVEEMRRVPGWLTTVDRQALAGYCQSWGNWVMAEITLQAAGRVYETAFMDSSGNEHKQLKPNPFVKIAKDERKAMLDFASHLGFSPSTRAKVNVNPEVGADGEAIAVES